MLTFLRIIDEEKLVNSDELNINVTVDRLIIFFFKT